MREWLIASLGGGATALAIVVAVIGLAGALGGAATSYFVAQKTVYINAITTERMKWITLLRSNIANLIGQLTIIRVAVADRAKVSDDKLLDTFTKMNELANSIELQLNPTADVDKSVISILRRLYKITNASKISDIESDTAALVAHSQWLLKNEWERVKSEARGPFGKLLSILKIHTRSKAYCKFLKSAEGRLPLPESIAIR